MPPARATHRHRQIALAFSNVMRDQIRQQALDSPQKFVRLRKRADIARHARILAAEGAQPRDEVWIRQKAHVENKIRVRGNAVAKSKAHHGNEQRPPPRILETVNDELAQLVYVEFRGVNNHIREAPNGRHAPPLFPDSFGDRDAVAQRMRPAGLTETPNQCFVACFDEDERRGMVARQGAVENGELFDLLSFSRVHQQRGTLDFAAALVIQLAEDWNQCDGKIIHAIKAKVLEGIQHGALARAGKSSEDYQLAGVSDSGSAISSGASPGGALHGGRAANLLPAVGACWGCASPRGIWPPCGA